MRLVQVAPPSGSSGMPLMERQEQVRQLKALLRVGLKVLLENGERSTVSQFGDASFVDAQGSGMLTLLDANHLYANAA
jgi:hypothetical protein